MISIILLNYKNCDLTIDCINSIITKKFKTEIEIIVVDNDSKDGSYEKLKRIFPELKIIQSGRNGGFAFGNNIGIKQAKGEYLLLLNNDTILHDINLDLMIETFETNSDIGIMGCRAIDKEKKELAVGHSFENYKRLLIQYYIKPFTETIGIHKKIIDGLQTSKYKEKKRLIEYDWICGAFLLIKKELYYEVGGLDENFFMYMEDEDLCFRIKAKGYKIVVFNQIGYTHYCGGSTIFNKFLTVECIKSRLLFYKRVYPNKFSKISDLILGNISKINPSLNNKEQNEIKSTMRSYINNDLDIIVNFVRGIQ